MPTNSYAMLSVLCRVLAWVEAASKHKQITFSMFLRPLDSLISSHQGKAMPRAFRQSKTLGGDNSLPCHWLPAWTYLLKQLPSSIKCECFLRSRGTFPQLLLSPWNWLCTSASLWQTADGVSSVVGLEDVNWQRSFWFLCGLHRCPLGYRSTGVYSCASKTLQGPCSFPESMHLLQNVHCKPKSAWWWEVEWSFWGGHISGLPVGAGFKVDT